MNTKMFVQNFKKQKGAAAVEFAIILPILIMLVFGIIEFGIAYNNWISLTHAAREGVRLAAVEDYENMDDFEKKVRDSSPSVNIETIKLTGQDGNIGDSVTVEVTGAILNIDIPLVGSWPVQITSEATMRLENKL